MYVCMYVEYPLLKKTIRHVIETIWIKKLLLTISKYWLLEINNDYSGTNYSK